jgi:hypothetical protein
MKRIVAALCLAFFTCCSALAQTLTAPERVKMGAKFQVTLAGEYDAKDFVSVVTPEAKEGQYDAYEYARAATVRSRLRTRRAPTRSASSRPARPTRRARRGH